MTQHSNNVPMPNLQPIILEDLSVVVSLLLMTSAEASENNNESPGMVSSYSSFTLGDALIVRLFNMVVGEAVAVGEE